MSGIAVITTALIGLSACSPDPPEAVDCSELATGDADAAVMILTDRLSPAVERTLDKLVSDPKAVFASDALRLDDGAGVVIVAIFDDLGQVDDIGSFNLNGIGPDDARRRGNAKAQADCLQDVGQLLPEETAELAPGNLLRALTAADEILVGTGADQKGLVIHGFSRSDNDGFEPWGGPWDPADLPAEHTDLSAASQRDEVLNQLMHADLVPSLESTVVLVAPAEGVPSGIAAADIASFAAEELCPVLSNQRCVSVEVLS